MFTFFLSLCTWTGAYTPHYPSIWNWELSVGDTEKVIVNLTTDEQPQFHLDLCSFMPTFRVWLNHMKGGCASLFF